MNSNSDNNTNANVNGYLDEFLDSNNLNNSNDLNDSNNSDDSDDYVDLADKAKENLKHIFQFHLNNEKLFVKYIGKSSDPPDIIIMENFGPDKNLSLYNCVYSHDELESVNKSVKNGVININENENENENMNFDQLELFFPIVKLVVKDKDNITISSIAIKLEQEIVYEKEIDNWSLYWVENLNTSEFIKTLKLKKDINPRNILEKIVHYSLTNYN